MHRFLLIFFITISSFLVAKQGAMPSILYLTWVHDPTSTMTIQWHSCDKEAVSEVLYCKKGESEWLNGRGTYTQLPKTHILVHTVELLELDADSDYEFKIANKQGLYLFRTMPKTLSRPVRYVVGGDAYVHLNLMQRMNTTVASLDPDFVVMGGDIAYTHGRKSFFRGKGWEVKRWRAFLREWSSHMVTKEGRLIPILAVLGNHDIRGVGLDPRQHQTLFYDLFALPEKGVSFRAFDVGNYLSLMLLDSDHGYCIKGKQTEWLKRALSWREQVPYKMAVYHISAYPSVYPFDGKVARQVRKYWVPLFEEYQVKVAFEHHNHAYKRTFPLKDGKVDPNGVVYAGDGSWGVCPRRPKKYWYLETAKRKNAVCLVTLNADRAEIDALSINGESIDTFSVLPNQLR